MSYDEVDELWFLADGEMVFSIEDVITRFANMPLHERNKRFALVFSIVNDHILHLDRLLR